MELPQHFEKCTGLAQNARSQQMCLRVERPSLQPPVMALAHDPLHVFMGDLEILQQRTFELIAAVRILRNVLHPLQGQTDMAVSNRLPE
jgi:hypothetical protein